MRILSLLLIVAPLVGKAQSIAGKWTTVDDKSGEDRSIVEIFEKGGKFYGKVVRIYPGPGEDPDPVCDECPSDDPRHNKKIIGMEILKGLEPSGDFYDNGKILDPEEGKIYRCKVWIDGEELKVRGYWGPFYRTQTWRRSH